ITGIWIFPHRLNYFSMKELFDLSGKVALVTGATHGLGMAMAKSLAKSGATLIINGNTPDKMKMAIEEYAADTIEAHGFLFDVTDAIAVDKQVTVIEEKFGPIHILVNNAGMIMRVPALDMGVGDFRKVVDVDLVSPFILSQ